MSMTINGTSGLTFNDASTQNTAATGFGFKNRIINGAMMIDQRNAGASAAITTADTYRLDRWSIRSDATGLSGTIQQSSVAPAGFTNSIILSITTGGTIGSSDRGNLAQYIEGFNVADLGFGTASASTVTLSFWVRSSLTGTFSGALQNSAVNRSYVFTYAINSANTWEYKTVTISGDTAGTWVGATNGVGLRLWLDIGNGSSLRTSTTGSWQAGDLRGATGAVSLVANSGATFYITGVQLEKGSTATSFDYRPYGTEFALCQRYYEVVNNTNVGISLLSATLTGSNCWGQWVYKQTKRATPTFGFYSGSGWVNATPIVYLATDIMNFNSPSTFSYAGGTINSPSCFVSAEL